MEVLHDMKNRTAPTGLFSVVAGALAAILAVGCAETVNNSGKAQLQRRGIQFTPAAFLAAAGAGKADDVQLFLSEGMNPNVQDEYGTTALVEAAQQGHADVISLLARAGAQLNYQPPKRSAAIIEAAEYNHADAVRALIAAGADLNIMSSGSDPGWTALSRAALLDHWEIVKLLAEAGANPNAVEGSAWPALATAAERNQIEIVQLLLEKGADPNYRFPGGASILWKPVWNGNTQVVRLLLEAGTQVPAKDRKILLTQPGGKPIKPEIRRLLLKPPKTKQVARTTGKNSVTETSQSAGEAAKATSGEKPSGSRALQLGHASGTLVFNKKTTALTNAYAFWAKEEAEGKGVKRNVVVLLTNMPLPQEAITEWSELSQLADAGKLQAVELTITPDKQVVAGQFWHKDKSFSATGMHVFEPTTFNGKVVAGKLSIPSEGEFFGTTYQYTATFATRVIQPQKPMTKSSPSETTAAEQSDQGRLYRVYEKALRDGDMTALKKCMTKDRAQELEEAQKDPQMKDMIELIRMTQPQKITLLKLQETADKAELFTTGKGEGGGVQTGTVSFVKEDGAWRILQESWKGTFK